MLEVDFSYWRKRKKRGYEPLPKLTYRALDSKLKTCPNCHHTWYPKSKKEPCPKCGQTSLELFGFSIPTLGDEIKRLFGTK